MNELPRRKLLEIVAKHGRSIIENPRRCENFARLLRRISARNFRFDDGARRTRRCRYARRARFAAQSYAGAPGAKIVRQSRFVGNSGALVNRIVGVGARHNFRSGTCHERNRKVQPKKAEFPSVQNNFSSQSPRKQRARTNASNRKTIKRSKSNCQSYGFEFGLRCFANGGGNYTSISEACEMFQPNSRLLIREGLYHESIVLDKNFEIVGDGAAENIIVRSTNQAAFRCKPKSDYSRFDFAGTRQIYGKAFFAVDVPRAN
jgi:hypothetical protein